MVDAGRHDLDALGGPRRTASRAARARRSVDASIRSAHAIDFVLDARAVLGIVVDAGVGLDARQRVERRDERHVEQRASAGARPRPTTSSSRAATSTGSRREHAAPSPRRRTARRARAARCFGTGARGPASTCKHPKAGLDLHDRGLGAVLGARVHVALDAGARRAPTPGPARRRSCRRRRRHPAAPAATCASRTRRCGGRTSAREVIQGRPGARSPTGERSARFGVAGAVLALERAVDLDEHLLLALADRDDRRGSRRRDRRDRRPRCARRGCRPGRRASRPRCAAHGRCPAGSRPTACAARARSGSGTGFEMPARSLSLRNDSRALRR